MAPLRIRGIGFRLFLGMSVATLGATWAPPEPAATPGPALAPLYSAAPSSPGSPAAPSVSLEKTVGTDAGVCAVTSSITVDASTLVTYCFELTNTGTVGLTRHTVVDDHLGTLLNDFPYSLSPGASVFFTESAVITVTTVNTATWTAFNPGPVDQTASTATATVTVTSTGGPTLSCGAAPVSFEYGLPLDWSVDDATGGSGIDWTTTADTANCGLNNLTGGLGHAACANSDITGQPNVAYNTLLVSNPLNLTIAYSATLTAAAYYDDLGVGNDLFRVQVGSGLFWITVLTWDEDHKPGAIALDLSSYAGQTNRRVRFRYSGNGFDWYAQVDDVALTCAIRQYLPLVRR